MPLFVMIARDGPEGAARRGTHREGHMAHIRKLEGEGCIAYAGPIRDDANTQSTGAVVVLSAANLDEARRIVNQDPFVSGGVFESLSVHPFKQVIPEPS